MCLCGKTRVYIWLVLVIVHFIHVTFLNPGYKLSDAVNKAGYCMRFYESVPCLSSILPGSTAFRAVMHIKYINKNV